MIGTSQLINAFGAPVCFTDTTDIFKDRSGVALYGLDYDASDAGGTSGKFGEAAIFNGSSSVITINSLFDFSSSFSISMWFNADALPSSTYAPLFFTDGYGGSDSDYGIGLYLYGNTIKPWIDRQGTYTNIFTAGTLSTGTWYHVVLNRDYNSDWELFLNGSSLGTYTSAGLTDNYTPSSFSTIGKHANSSMWFDGKIDQVRIYDTALTQPQVTQLYQENASTLTQHLFGCLATYNFDGSARESLGTTAYDGTETDITYRYDGTPTAVDFGVGGKSNYGARFDGSSSNIQINRFSEFTNYNFTLSVWIKTTDTSAYITSFRDPMYITLGTGLYSGGTHGMGIYDGTNQYFINNAAMQGINDGNWHHIVMTHDGTNLKGYIDGSLIGTVSTGTTTQFSGGTNYNRIGVRADGNTAVAYDGDIDQLRLFNKAISAAEVSKLYGNGAGEVACAYTSTTDNVALPITNTAYYKLDNNSKDSARSTGKFNEGAIFNGSSSKISTTINNSDVESFSLWFYWESGTTIGRLLGSNVGSDGGNLAVEVATNGAISAQLQNLRYAAGSGALGSTGWKHIYYDTNRDLYINGTLHTGGTDGTDSKSSSTVLIGALRTNYGFINTIIDQIRFYDVTLSAADVSNLYAETASDTNTLSFPPGQTAIATYTFDGNSTDLSGNYNGTDTNITYAYDGTESNIEYRFGRFGQAAVFDGSSTKITTSYDALFNDFSISFWVKINDLSYYQVLLGTTDAFASLEGLGIFYDSSSNTIGFDGNINGTRITSQLGSYQIIQNQWHHVVFTNNSSNDEKILYIDNVVQVNNTSIGYIDGQNYDLVFGSYNAFSNSRLKGSIDQVRIYDTALTSDQVTELYNEKPEVDTSNFKTVLYEANASTNFISNVGMDLETNGGLVWLKSRDNAYNHGLFDSVRGTNNLLQSNTTAAENSSVTNTLNSFEKTGFFLGQNENSNYLNNTSSVGWVWRGGGDAVSNTDGSITSQVSANTDAGFSIVKYTGNSTDNATVGHGLSVAPNLVIVKDLDSSNYWCVGGSTVGDGENLYLNVTTERQTRDRVKSVQTDTFTLGSHFEVNSTNDFIAYCFHSVSGYSSIGTYSYNPSGDKRVYTTNDGTSTGTGGFQPKWVMIKKTNDASNWVILDSIRVSGNLDGSLSANTSNDENITSDRIEFHSDGFTVIGSNTATNTGDHIYLAIA